MTREKLPYYLRRIRSFGPRSLVRRILSGVRHRVEERRLRSDPLRDSPVRVFEHRGSWFLDHGSKGMAAAVEETLLESLPAGWWQEKGFWEAFRRLYPEAAQECLDSADLVVSGSLKLFQWKVISIPDSWSSTLGPSNPHELWPARHHARIGILHDEKRPARDIKWCWEFNRFQHLLHLGAAWNLTRDEIYPRTARRHLETWMEEIVHPAGVQWSSNLEVALRTLSWIRCHILCRESEFWDEEFLSLFIACLHVHGRHLEEELTDHHALSNHLLGESCAMIVLAALYPGLKGAERRLKRGTAILERISDRLFHGDGAYAEQSTGYLAFACEFLLELIHIQRACNSFSISDSVSEAIASALRFVRSLTPDPSRVPMIGDSDSGHAVGWKLSHYWDFRPLFATAAALFNDRSLARGMEEFPAESFLMLGPDGLHAFQAIQERSPRAEDISCSRAEAKGGALEFPKGGYMVSRDPKFHVVFDAGPLGIPPGYGHGHADGLSLLLFHESVPVLIDTGTFLYNGDPAWREYFRSTAAHNTVAMDGISQARPAGTFLWGRPLKIESSGLVQDHSWSLMRGSVRWPWATHERTVVHLFQRGLVILDRITGEGRHSIDLNFHLGPDCHPRRIGRREFDLDCPTGRLRLSLLVSGNAAPSVLCGSDEPRGGWYSPLYALRIPIFTIRFSAEGDLPQRLVTVIGPEGTEPAIQEDLLDAGVPGEIAEEFSLAAIAPSMGLVKE